MIKLIATDMDGTLLDENGKIPEGFFETLEKLNKKDIKFVVASGRPYPTLYKNFSPNSDEIEYICDNGSYVVLNNRQPVINGLDKEVIHKIIKTCESIDNIAVLLCGVKGAYHLPCDDKFLTEINKYYIEKHVVDDLYSVDDNIFKIAICDLSNSAENSYKILNPLFGKENKVVVSGKLWVDVNGLNVNKGNALKEIQELYGITYEETMVFGDFYNDVEMLKEAYYSFVMENANEDMKQYGNFIAESNSNYGVIKAINKFVLNEENTLV
ncbi:MAG: HAD family hydrolase [Clostridium sp.]